MIIPVSIPTRPFVYILNHQSFFLGRYRTDNSPSQWVPFLRPSLATLHRLRPAFTQLDRVVALSQPHVSRTPPVPCCLSAMLGFMTASKVVLLSKHAQQSPGRPRLVTKNHPRAHSFHPTRCLLSMITVPRQMHQSVPARMVRHIPAQSRASS